MGVNTYMALKLDPVDLMLYADVAEAFEHWLTHNPEGTEDPMGCGNHEFLPNLILISMLHFYKCLNMYPKKKWSMKQLETMVLNVDLTELINFI